MKTISLLIEFCKKSKRKQTKDSLTRLAISLNSHNDISNDTIPVRD